MATNPNCELIGPIKRGRPSSYTDEIAQEICERIANGETLTEICRDEDMPGRSTVTEWLMYDREGFSGLYAQARAIQAIHEDDESKEIADNLAILPEHKRIMIDTRKWRAERLNRRVYGNSTRHEHALAQPDGPALEPGSLPGSLSFLDSGGESEQG
jgi:hypothetical protein